MVWGSDNVDPYKDDEIRRDMALYGNTGGNEEDKIDSEDSDLHSHDDKLDAAIAEAESYSQGDVGDKEEIEENNSFDLHIPNEQLSKVIEFYDCAYMLPFAERIQWLSSVKEVLGTIPSSFNVTRDEIVGLVILNSEVCKKSQFDIYRSKQKQKSQEASNNPSAAGLPYQGRYRAPQVSRPARSSGISSKYRYKGQANRRRV